MDRLGTDISFRSIGLIAKVDNERALSTCRHLLAWLKPLGLKLAVDQQTASKLTSTDGLSVFPLPGIARHIDLAVVIGGDGSLLSVARAVAPNNVPVVGVNRGSLGFLAEIHPQALEAEMKQVLHGHYREERRFLLSSEVLRNGHSLFASLALNDVVVHAGTTSRMMWFRLVIDGEEVYFQRSDGVIIASPTGSTAYSLSAGGPIMHPTLNAIAIVPMFPHDLTSRPIVVSGSSEVIVVVGESNAPEPRVSCDSQVDYELQPADQVRVSKGCDFRLLRSVDYSFYAACRNKLDWASRSGINSG